jgi:pyridinium-3,5-biscarboxylic acid mononucleotide sulfurtransferase
MELHRKSENLNKGKRGKLSMVRRAEELLIDMGFKNFKIRNYGASARIEVAPYERVCFFDLDIMDKVGSELKKIGFEYVTLDLIGSRNDDSTEIIAESEK